MRPFILGAFLLLAGLPVAAVPGVSNSILSAPHPQQQKVSTASEAMLHNSPLCFVENKGQVTDQNGQQRKDIDYKIAVKGMSVFVGNGQLHYMLSSQMDSTHIEMYRVDVQLLGANKHAQLICEDMQEYKEIYYLPYRQDGIIASTCQKITYKDIYPDIDWVIYTRNNQLEYDFVVRPGGRVADIRMAYSGATNLTVTEKKGLAAVTPLGTITEHQPMTYEQESKQTVASKFVQHGNVISFNTGSYTGTLVIDPDPALDWATYYGGSGTDYACDVTCDAGGNVYMTGFTTSTSNIASTGSYQSTWTLTGMGANAFLVKFNATGARQWATYYGGNVSTEGSWVACDPLGNVYMTGFANGPGLATTGSYQPAYNGNSDVILVKFNNSGLRQWATYFGGDQLEYGQRVACDGVGNVYIGGETLSTYNIATVGSHQNVNLGGSFGDDFLAKFDPAGNLLWATYYGGNIENTLDGLICDGAGHVYIGGSTQCNTNIATSGSYQPYILGSGVPSNSFLAQFDSTGRLLWGTYFGERSSNGLVACDQAGHVYLSGFMQMQATSYATPGSFQSAEGAGNNVFLAQFNTAGNLQWATYYGGNNSNPSSITCDTTGNVYMAGTVKASSTNVATPASYQTTYSGAFLAKFNTAGQRVWGTYYGGAATDQPYGLACYGPDIVYMTGITAATTGIATAGSYQTTNGGGQDGFLARFRSDITVAITEPFADTVLCAGSGFSLNYIATESFQAGNTFTAQLSDAAGSFAHPVNTGSYTGVSNGTITCTIPAGTTTGTGYKLRIVASAPKDTSVVLIENISVINLSGITAHASSGCLGSTITLQADSVIAGQTYRWTGPNSFGSNTRIATIPNANNTDSGTYTVVTTVGSCSQTVTAHVVISPAPAKPVAGSNSPLCAGGTIDLTTTTTPGAGINWTGPNGFRTTTQNPVIAGAPVADSGLYIVTESIGGCSVSDSVVVSVTNPTAPKVSITTSTPYLVPGYSGTFHAHAIGCAKPAYQWYRGKTPLAGQTDSVLTILIVQHDSINVVMHCNSGCIQPDSAKSNFLGPEGVASISQTMNAVVIYPNPVGGFLVIEHAKGATARICNVVGQELMTQVLTSDKETINTAALPVGTFVITLVSGDGRWSKVMVKE